MASENTPPTDDTDSVVRFHQNPIPTGAQIVIFKEGVTNARAILDKFAESGASKQGFSVAAFGQDNAEAADAVLIEEIGMAIISERDGAGQSMAAANALAAASEVQETIPEFYYFATDVNPTAAPAAVDTAAATWGVQTVKADTSSYTGDGIKIAILDTGIDTIHPDLAGRIGLTKSFVTGEVVQDLQGHGTHCAGTAAGPRATGSRPRYGVAPDAEIMVGKVLNNAGSGRTRDILRAMLWAADNGADIISMSLGRPTRKGEKPEPIYLRAAEYALRKGALVVAAAGNNSRRQYGYVAPVGSPANCPNIMAVAAIDNMLDVAYFSCGGINPGGGEINVAAPGVDIFSSLPAPHNYDYLHGTSMACPHVAGVAALWAETDPLLRGRKLWKKIEATAKKAGLSSQDAGKGIVQSP